MQIIKGLMGEKKYYDMKIYLNINARKKWIRFVFKDLKSHSSVPFKQKLWGYRRGFLSYRIDQLKLTSENVSKFVSDFDYMKLYPINNRFMFWIDDKLTMRYILSGYSEFLPEYYFHLTKRSRTGVLKLIDCPDDYSADLQGIIDLLKSINVLAIKPLSGTFGSGFYKIACKSGEYCINGHKTDENTIRKLLESMNDHIVTEYVEMHNELKKTYGDSLNTIRLLVVNENGNDPFIGTAAIKFGTKRSGTVDNISAGGICCKIDIKSGYYCDGFGVKNYHEFYFCKIHPDSKQKLEGFIPNWQHVKDNILKICMYIPQLEYMGFDIAVTPNGFKIIEINSHQGMNRTADLWSQNLISYFSRLMKRKGIKTRNGF